MPSTVPGEKVRVYTTRPDTLFGATYMVLSPEHPLVDKLKDQITNYDACIGLPPGGRPQERL